MFTSPRTKRKRNSKKTQKVNLRHHDRSSSGSSEDLELTGKKTNNNSREGEFSDHHMDLAQDISETSSPVDRESGMQQMDLAQANSETPSPVDRESGMQQMDLAQAISETPSSVDRETIMQQMDFARAISETPSSADRQPSIEKMDLAQAISNTPSSDIGRDIEPNSPSDGNFFDELIFPQTDLAQAISETQSSVVRNLKSSHVRKSIDMISDKQLEQEVALEVAKDTSQTSFNDLFENDGIQLKPLAEANEPVALNNVEDNQARGFLY